MLGFLRSRLDKQEMLMQQHKAVGGILHWCEAQDEVKMTGNTVRAATGEHLDWVRAMRILRAMNMCNASDCGLCAMRLSVHLSTSIVPSRITCSTRSTWSTCH